MRRIAIALLTVVATSSAYAQQGPVNGQGRPPADTHFGAGPADQQTNPAAPKADPAEEARKRIAAWQNAKEQCFVKAGLTKGMHYRPSPQDQLTFQIADRVWFDNRFDHAAIKKCQ